MNTNVSPESFAVILVLPVIAVTGVLRPYTLAFVCDVLPITIELAPEPAASAPITISLSVPTALVSAS